MATVKLTKKNFKKTIEAKVVPATLETIRKYSGKIYVDETNLQRLIDKWSDQIASDHMTACLKGHSNIYTIVLISINGVINDNNNYPIIIYKNNEVYSDKLISTIPLNDFYKYWLN